MGAPVPKMEPIDSGTAEALLSSLQSIDPTERRKHASIFNYWLSIRGDRPFPPIRDLDPLEISDAGPWSVLLELISNGENAVIRHIGQDIKLGIEAETIARAPSPSLLTCIHAKLPVVASSMQAMAFEDSFEGKDGPANCWVTLLPFSTNGSSVDYVYAFVSLGSGEPEAAVAEEPAVQVEALESGQVPLGPLDEILDIAEAGPADLPEEAEQPPEPELEALELESEPESAREIEQFEPEALASDAGTDPAAELQSPDQTFEPLVEIEADSAPLAELEPEPVAELPEPEPDEPAPEDIAELNPKAETAADEDYGLPPKAGFSARFMESLASVGGFYGRVVHPADPVETAQFEELPAEEPAVEADFAEAVAEEAAAEESPAEDPAVEAANVVEAVVEEAAAEEPIADIATEPTFEAEGTLQSKLTEVRAMAEEARQAQLRSQLALIAGLSAAYDFALDAEGEPEEYLRLVEGQGLKIQLRAPMKPVVKLAFADTCDDATINQLEAVLAWALKQDLPRGTLADRIEAEGGIGSILEGLGKAA